jgi:hypothetical protein
MKCTGNSLVKIKITYAERSEFIGAISTKKSCITNSLSGTKRRRQLTEFKRRNSFEQVSFELEEALVVRTKPALTIQHCNLLTI